MCAEILLISKFNIFSLPLRQYFSSYVCLLAVECFIILVGNLVNKERSLMTKKPYINYMVNYIVTIISNSQRNTERFVICSFL